MPQAGVAVGMALLVARLANATSYLSDSPETCINCHVMTDAYARPDGTIAPSAGLWYLRELVRRTFCACKHPVYTLFGREDNREPVSPPFFIENLL